MEDESKKELNMLSRLSKHFGIKEVKALVNDHPHDGDMAKKQTLFHFNLAER